MSLDDRLRPQLEEISRQRAALRSDMDRLQGGGGGGTSGGVTDDWKEGVDRQLAQLHGDVRALLYGLIGGFLFLLAAGGYAYTKLSDQQAAAQVAQAKTDAKIDFLVERSVSPVK